MTIDRTTNIVAASEVDLVLYVKVHDTSNTIRAQETFDGVDHRVELWNHGQSVAHGEKLSTTSIRIFVQVSNILPLDFVFLALVGLRFVLVEAEGACILTDDFDVRPPKTSKTFASHLAKTWRKVDDVW